MSNDKRVLWVEDQIGTVKGTLKSAERHGHEVVLVASYNAAVSALKAANFDRVIVDYRIPSKEGEPPAKGCGLKLVNHILGREEELKIGEDQVLLLTAQTAALRRGLELKGEDRIEVLEKPGSHRKLIAWLDREVEEVE